MLHFAFNVFIEIPMEDDNYADFLTTLHDWYISKLMRLLIIWHLLLYKAAPEICYIRRLKHKLGYFWWI